MLSLTLYERTLCSGSRPLPHKNLTATKWRPFKFWSGRKIARNRCPRPLDRLIYSASISLTLHERTLCSGSRPLPHKNLTATKWRPFKFWSGRRDSNPRHQPWQGCTLPLSYTRMKRMKRLMPYFETKCKSFFQKNDKKWDWDRKNDGNRK